MISIQKLKNIGNEATPANEDIIVRYYIDNQFVGDDTENPLDPNQEDTEVLRDYQFSNSGTYDVRVEIEPASNESNTNNNSLTRSFQITVGSGGNTISITPANLCISAPTMQVNTEYEVTLSSSAYSNNYTKGLPIQGHSSGGNNIRAFWLAVQVPSGYYAQNISIYDVSSNFKPSNRAKIKLYSS